MIRKGVGKEGKLSHMGHVLAEYRQAVTVSVDATEVNGTAERTVAIDLYATHWIKTQKAPVDPAMAAAKQRPGILARGRIKRRMRTGAPNPVSGTENKEEGFGWLKTAVPVRRTQ